MQAADRFFEERMKRIFTPGNLVIDIGGGLRADPERNNRKKENPWLDDYIKNADYKIIDKVADYNPDIVGDIHDLPFEDNSVDAIICMSVLEHVEEPTQAVREMHRVLKPGGYCYIYAPFLFYYHPMKGYYGDFYRFTVDGIRYLARDFTEVEVQNARGAITTVFNLFPFFSKHRLAPFQFLDRIFKKEGSDQTSGYSAFCVK